MLTRIKKTRDDRDAGFTLIELLVVVVIIGILAAIAIPVFLNQRNAARNASAESDVRNVATVMETYYTGTGNGDYPTQIADLSNAGAKFSQGNALQVTVDNTAGSYVIIGCNIESYTADATALYRYESAGGGFVDPLAADTCDTTEGIAVS